MISLRLLTVPKIKLIGTLLLLGLKSGTAKCIVSMCVPYQPKKWYSICRVCRIGVGAPEASCISTQQLAGH